ncbi:YajQ family cyclic di-GMP-binding protein [Candidatus Comchoanobacter bicostacola]|uniref:Nucleotide-binding protein MMH89_03820 n=1 Tax=Candidatus Comchoanobacter bicostacola TaxID=2919598 RepID=A0ABY5DI89_9GAMM|nr:YajQ family cyclic di-GMP-binding protein [Candidatus Comchoanobacter bicostacola]UTC24345.1 YajQ family cyclic di-GMP-binding protein [Candidatus Comchoanobacter bicostacola]
MPTFDAVSEVSHHELDNAVQQTAQEISRRFDLKDTSASAKYDQSEITLTADDAFQIEQIEKVLQTRLVARKIDIKVLDGQDVETNVSSATKKFKIKEGISTEDGKQINKMIKASKIKAQSSIMDGKVRVTAKKIDDLRTIMDMIKEHNFNTPIQFNNFRD